MGHQLQEEMDAEQSKMGTPRKVVNKHFQNEGSHLLHYSLKTQVPKNTIHPEIWGGGNQIKMDFLYSKVTLC